MKRNLKRAIVGAAAAAIAFSALPATNAQAINRVTSGCPRDDFFQIFNEGTLCFANAGSIAVRIYNVYGGSAGNNRALIASQGYSDEPLARDEVIAFHPNRYVTRLQIF
jgi:hypothetical protein